MKYYRLNGIPYLLECQQRGSLPYYRDAHLEPEKPQNGICAFEDLIFLNFQGVVCSQEIDTIGDEISIMEIETDESHVITDPFAEELMKGVVVWKGSVYIQEEIKTIDVSIIGYVTVTGIDAIHDVPLFSTIVNVNQSVDEYLSSYYSRHTS